jgi:hypothetical protein
VLAAQRRVKLSEFLKNEIEFVARNSLACVVHRKFQPIINKHTSLQSFSLYSIPDIMSSEVGSVCDGKLIRMHYWNGPVHRKIYAQNHMPS